MIMAKDETYNKMISSERWKRLRKCKLSQNPLCERCLADDSVTSATEVHHTHPVEEAYTVTEKEQRMYDVHNLMSVCRACHVAIHAEMGRSGKGITQERVKSQVEGFIKKFLE